MDPRTIADNKLFAGIGARQVAEAATVAEHVAFAPGERLWGEGDASRGVILVLDGELAVTQRSTSGAVVEVARLGPGDFLGATSTVLGTDIHSGTVTAATAVRAGLIPPDRFAALTASEPRLVTNAVMHLVASLRRANARLLEAAERDRDELERRVSQRTADLERVNRRVQRELEIAQRIQRNLLPERRREFPGVTASAEYLPCEELGGDIVGAFQVDETRIALYGGDVSGHGIYAAMVMSYVKKLVESSVKRILLKGQYVVKPPGAVLTSINQAFMAEISLGDAEIYLTLFFGILDLRNLELTYASAGIHRVPLVVSGGRLEELFTQSDFPIGHVESHEYETHRRQLGPGDSFLFVSDGVVEADHDGEAFGLARLKAEVLRLSGQPGGLDLSALAGSVSAFLRGQPPRDDMCFLLLDIQSSLSPVQ
jgi:sigma-B regulation protein RsbU (phosphoserine phosphatase)